MLAALLLFMPWNVVGAEPAKVQMPKVVDQRLTISLYAADPEIVTPTGIAVDRKGRVLVIESHTHFRPEGYKGPAADRILAFEGVKADGRAAKRSVFFEGTTHTMNLGIAPDQSVYVATRMEVFRLRDTDGDGNADERTPIVHLETPGNYPHNGLSGFAFDLANNVYFGFGENLGAEYKLIGSDGRTLVGGGEGGNIYRCHADGSDVTRIATGFWNPFHLCFDAFGRLFTVDNDPDSRPPCRLIHVVANGDYGYRFRNGRKGLHPFTAWNGELPGTLPMVAGTGEAPSGVLAYESDNLPKDYLGTLLVTSWGDHRIERYRLLESGASFRSSMEPIVTGGENFRPVGIATAPDGSLFISDWVDKSYPLHGKGRIWHLKAKQPAVSERPTDPAKALLSVDRDTREAAARQLRNEEGQVTLKRALADDNPKVRALAFESMILTKGVREAEIRRILQDASPEVRALAVRTLPAEHAKLDDILSKETSPAVRAEMLCRFSNAAAPLLAALGAPDPFLQLAARQRLTPRRGMKDRYVEARTPDIDLRDLISSAKANQRLAALLILRESNSSKDQESLGKFLDDSDPDVRFAAVQWVAEQNLSAYRDRVAAGLGSGGTMTRRLFEGYLAALERLDGVKRTGKDEIAGEEYVVKLLSDGATSPAVQRRCLRVLRPDHPWLTVNRLSKLLASPDPQIELEAVRSLRESKDAKSQELLRQVALDAKRPTALRAEAVVGLRATTSKERKSLLELAEGKEPALQAEALRSLRGAELDSSERERLGRIGKASPATAELVAKALQPATPSTAAKKIELAEWNKLLEGQGDAAVGERLFFRTQGAACFRCHQMDGRGGRVGPDLSNTANVLTRERLIESIVEPSKEIAPMFVPWTIVKTDGSVLSGILVDEGLTGEQSYADSKGDIFTLKPDEIEERRPQKTSIMPDDLGHAMTPTEFRDLLEYLRQPRQ